MSSFANDHFSLANKRKDCHAEVQLVPDLIREGISIVSNILKIEIFEMPPASA